MQIDPAQLFCIAAGVVIGCLIAWAFLRQRFAHDVLNTRATAEMERTLLAEQLKSAQQDSSQFRDRLLKSEASAETIRNELDSCRIESAQLKERTERIPLLEDQIVSARGDLDKSQKSLTDQRDGFQSELAIKGAELSKITEELASERRASQEKLETLQQARQELSDQFKTLANEILEEKSRKFTEQNQNNLGQLLTPLREQLTDFKSKVEQVYDTEGKERSALAQQVKQLMDLNQSLSSDANNLAMAIRGDRKAQGNWGEIILEDVLEKAGLARGQHYDRQSSIKSDDGLTHVIPDVVIKLPLERHIVVDSKLTLPDYRAYADATEEDDRSAALKRHLLFIRNHIKGLSEKNYQSLYGLKSLDFVVMFVPLEPAFMLAVTNDRELFQFAWERNILLVSPSTLLFVVRTVAHLWRQEGLSRNAKEISNRGAELYDKLVGFVTDLEAIGGRLKQAQESYSQAKKKLSEGNGNVIRQAELLKQLGVKPTKSLPSEIVELSLESVLPEANIEILPKGD